jgi:hypothetical protein
LSSTHKSAKDAEKNRKRELEQGFNNVTDQRQERIRTFRDMADDCFSGYKIRLPDSASYAEYAVDHLKRLLGSKMLVDFSEAVVTKYQNDRLEEGAAPKTVNEEVGFLLRILEEPGDVIRVRLRKMKMLQTEGPQDHRQGVQRRREKADSGSGCECPVSTHLSSANADTECR